jgi:hypothetical protein
MYFDSGQWSYSRLFRPFTWAVDLWYKSTYSCQSIRHSHIPAEGYWLCYVDINIVFMRLLQNLGQCMESMIPAYDMGMVLPCPRWFIGV